MDTETGEANEVEPPSGTELEPGYFFLLPCSVCGRNFNPESLSRHQVVCEKNAQKKRPVFDSSKQRLQGTDIPLSPSTSPSSVTKRSYSSLSPAKKRQSKWKEQHNDLIQSVRAAKAIVPGDTTPVIGPTFRKRSTTVFQSVPDDCTPCPYCERSFGGKAFDRHLEWCKDQRNRLPNSPTDQTTEAKERLEARIKYRAPAPRRSLRDMTREKYSPTRSIPSSCYSGYGRSVASTHSSQSGYEMERKSHGGSQSSLNSKLSAAVSAGAATFSRASVADSEASSIRSGQSQISQVKSAFLNAGKSPSNLMSNFNRNTGSRHSLRSLPSQRKETKNETSTQNRAPFLAGAARSSFRVKTNTTQQQQTPPAKPLLGTQTIGRNFGTKVKPLASPVLGRRNGTTPRPSALDLFSPGKRSEPEGVESMMTASCIQLDSRKKDLNNQIVPVLKDEKNKIPKDSYDPYLSAQKQMEELLDCVSNFGTSSQKDRLFTDTKKENSPPVQKEKTVQEENTVEKDTTYSSLFSRDKGLYAPQKESSLYAVQLDSSVYSKDKNGAYTDEKESSPAPPVKLENSVLSKQKTTKYILEPLQLDSPVSPGEVESPVYPVPKESPFKEYDRPVLSTLIESKSFSTLPRKLSEAKAEESTASPYSTIQRMPRSTFASVFKTEDRTLNRKDSTDSDSISSPKRSTSIPRPVYSRSNSAVQDAESMLGIRSRSRSQAPSDRVPPSGEVANLEERGCEVRSPETPKPIYPRTAAVFKHETPPHPPPRKSLQTSLRKEQVNSPPQYENNREARALKGLGLRLDEQSRQRVAALEADLKQILSGINELGLLSQSSFERPHTDESDTRSPSKFCHSCGTPYPVTKAKFCCSCGEKRLYC